MGCS
jgi:hypothetical protein